MQEYKGGEEVAKEMQEEVKKDSNVLEVQIEKLEEKCK